MALRISACVFIAILCVKPVFAQQTDAQQLQLDLDKFPDTSDQSASEQSTNSQNEELQLNLDQFDNKDPATVTNDSNGELKLDLEQFDNNQENPNKDLELNLEQFDQQKNSNDSETPTTDGELELDLDKFDKNSESSAQVGKTDSSATRMSESASARYNYRHIFLVGGLVLIVFLYFMSRRRKSRR